MAARREFRVTDIADQSGLSRATVDRVLHGRHGVRPETVAQVRRAIEELRRQRSQLHLSGRPVILDLVMQAPDRFAQECRRALEAELSGLRPALARARFSLTEHSDPKAAAELLDGIVGRRSHGVILKAPDHPLVAAAIQRLADSGIPTTTFVTDVSDSPRVSYVGVDNAAAGATAAYLIQHWRPAVGAVLVTLSSSTFRGEEERARGFVETFTRLDPTREILRVTDTDGLDDSMEAAVRDVLGDHCDIDAVYSIGGGNRAILAAFAKHLPAAFIAHDLDTDNRALLRAGQLTAVLHHDLRADLRCACQALLQSGGLLPGKPVSIPSQVQVVTRFNEPASLAPSRATSLGSA